MNVRITLQIHAVKIMSFKIIIVWQICIYFKSFKLAADNFVSLVGLHDTCSISSAIDYRSFYCRVASCCASHANTSNINDLSATL